MKITEVTFTRGVVKPQDYPSDGYPQIAFVGRSNVGKSSLINSLLGGQKVARTSNTPGRTQQINFFLINKQWYFVDLPGYGYARVSKQVHRHLQYMIQNYLAQRDALMLSILLVDSRHLPSELDLQAKLWFEERAKPFLVVLTKSDKLSNNELRNQLIKIKAALGTEQVIPYSTVTGLGKDALWSTILSHLAL